MAFGYRFAATRGVVLDRARPFESTLAMRVRGRCGGVLLSPSRGERSGVGV